MKREIEQENLDAKREKLNSPPGVPVEMEEPEVLKPAMPLETNETEANEPEAGAPTTEKATEFKVMWGNIGLHSKKDVMKYLDSIDLQYFRIKTAPKWDYCFIQFKQKEDLETAIEKLNELAEYKGRKTFTTIPKIRQQPSRQIEMSDKTPEEQIADQVTPWWNIPYDEQLLKKNEIVHKLIKQLERKLLNYIPRKIKQKPGPIIEGQSYDERIKKMTSDLRALEQLSWIKVKKLECEGMMCNIENIKGSPVTDGYRNKVEFSFGKDLMGNNACGFLLGMYKEGVTTVLNPSFCKNVPDKAKDIANILEEYVNQSNLEVYNRELKTGFFRCALVRILQSGEIMLLLQVQPSNVDVELEKTRFQDFINTKIKVNSLYWQESTDMFNGITEDMPMTLLQGTPYITEKLSGQE